MTTRQFYLRERQDGRAVLTRYPSGEPKSWITRVEGSYYRCSAEAIHVREVDADIDLSELPAEEPKSRVRPSLGWRSRLLTQTVN